jgi:hypothetical protein
MSPSEAIHRLTEYAAQNCTDRPDPELTMHIRALGLAGIGDYLGWCARHGFSRRTDKDWRLRLKERSYANRAVADARLARKKQETKRPKKVIEQIFCGELDEDEIADPHLKAVWRACETVEESHQTRRAFHELVQHASAGSGLVSSHNVIDQYGRQAGNTFVEGLLAIASHSSDWIRPVCSWKPRTHNTRRQFSSLARHLLARWPVPAFMDSVWFLGSGSEARRRQGWFLHLARGANIRTADLPLSYTKRMAHHFMQAPADLAVDGALRWGQIRALGGSGRLVRTMLGTRLATEFERDDFWITVLRFFIANPTLDRAHIVPLIDYIHRQRFVPQDAPSSNGVIERQAPPQPDFTMKGRTPASLLRQVGLWHRALAASEQPKAEWPRSGIDPFKFVEGNEHGENLRIWTITELSTSNALFAEGQTMKHCVAAYSRACARGTSSIWTLEVETSEGRSKVLTVEVQNATRLICQARGKANALPEEKHRGILRRWALEAGLGLAAGV